MNDYRIIDLGRLQNEKIACLTLDLEQDYGDLLNEPYYQGLEHIPQLVKLFQEKAVPLTCFVQGSLLETHADQVQQLMELDIEFELHSYSHPKGIDMNTKFEVEKGKEVFNQYFRRNPIGYRSPMGLIKEGHFESLAYNDFAFDSSIYPSCRPGFFNNLNNPTKPYIVQNSELVEFPLTTLSNRLRVPLTLSYIKLFGKPYEVLLKVYKLPALIIFAFHMHDLFGLQTFHKMPLKQFSLTHRTIFKRIYSNNRSDSMHTLSKAIDLLQGRGYSFVKMIDLYQCLHEEKKKTGII